MSASADSQHARDLMKQVDEQVHRAEAIDRAAQFMVERYDVPTEQALEFLERKALDGGRDPADVALEVVQGRRQNRKDL